MDRNIIIINLLFYILYFIPLFTKPTIIFLIIAKYIHRTKGRIEIYTKVLLIIYIYSVFTKDTEQHLHKEIIIISEGIIHFICLSSTILMYSIKKKWYIFLFLSAMLICLIPHVYYNFMLIPFWSYSLRIFLFSITYGNEKLKFKWYHWLWIFYVNEWCFLVLPVQIIYEVYFY